MTCKMNDYQSCSHLVLLKPSSPFLFQTPPPLKWTWLFYVMFNRIAIWALFLSFQWKLWSCCEKHVFGPKGCYQVQTGGWGVGNWITKFLWWNLLSKTMGTGNQCQNAVYIGKNKTNQFLCNYIERHSAKHKNGRKVGKWCYKWWVILWGLHTL